MKRKIVGAATLGLAQLWTASVSAQTQADLNQVLPSVVRVSLIGQDEYGDFFLFGVGSGFVAADGKVVTNNHVVASAQKHNLVIAITPHEGFGRPVPGRIVRTDPVADLALISAPDLVSPAARIAAPPAHTETVHAVGYPALVCDVLACSADERIAPTVPDFSTGPISRFADRTPQGGNVKTIFHRAAISGGNSGGPIVDQCGRVVGVNTWVSAAFVDQNGEIQAPPALSVATHSDELKSFLSRSGVLFIEDANPCRSAAQINAELNEKLEKMEATLAAEAETHRLEEERLSRERAAETQRIIMMAVGSVVALVALFGVILWAVLRGGKRPAQPSNHRVAAPTDVEGTDGPYIAPLASQPASASKKFPGALVGSWAVSACVLIGAIWFMMQDGKGAAAIEAGSPAPTDGMPSVVNLRCEIDQNASYGLDRTSGGTQLTFDRQNACVNGRTRYASEGTGYERMIVASNSRHLVINRFSSDLGTFIQDSYVVTGKVWTDADNAAKANIQGCPSDPARAQAQIGQFNDMRARFDGGLPSTPAKRVQWRCTPQ